MGTIGRARIALVTAAAAVALAAGVPAPGAAAPDDSRPAGPVGTDAAVDVAPVAPVAPHDPAAATALLAAWERSLAGAFTVESAFERRVDGDLTMAADAVLVQRPPDRLVRHGAAVTGRLGGRRVSCSAVEDDPVGCTDGGPAPSYADGAAAELSGVRRLVTGTGAPYAVTTDRDGCFSARLRVWSPAPVWGTAALFCFDPATGAPTLTTVTRPEGVDRTVARQVRPVRDADLALPGG